MEREIKVRIVKNEGYELEEYDCTLPRNDGSLEAIKTKLGLTKENHSVECITSSPPFYDLMGARLDSPTLKEMNFFAQRLAVMTEDERLVFQAVHPQYVDLEEEPVAIRDLINLTYGLGDVTVLSEIKNDAELGQFMIDTESSEDVDRIPKELRHLVDRAKLGEQRRKRDMGVFIGDNYIQTVEYNRYQMYDGETLPEEDSIFWNEVNALPSMKKGGELYAVMGEEPEAWTEEKFKEWLDDSQASGIVIDRKGALTHYIKERENDDFSLLYKKQVYLQDRNKRHEGYSYTGIYSHKHGLIYDSRSEFAEDFPNLVSKVSLDRMSADLEVRTRKRVEELLGGDSAKLTIKTLSKEQEANLEYYRVNDIIRDLKRYFIDEIGSDEIRYESYYHHDGWTDKDLFAYITDSDKFIDAEAGRYLRENQEEILWQFKQKDILREELKNLEGLEDSPLHRLRDIIHKTGVLDARTVMVTLNKGGQEFSFKYAVRELQKDPYSTYSKWEMSKTDRELFELRFGCTASFKPEDIVDISYRGKSIYSVEPYIPEQEQGQGPVQSM